jgi:hypothetical protein
VARYSHFFIADCYCSGDLCPRTVYNPLFEHLFLIIEIDHSVLRLPGRESIPEKKIAGKIVEIVRDSIRHPISLNGVCPVADIEMSVSDDKIRFFYFMGFPVGVTLRVCYEHIDAPAVYQFSHHPEIIGHKDPAVVKSTDTVNTLSDGMLERLICKRQLGVFDLDGPGVEPCGRLLIKTCGFGCSRNGNAKKDK